MVSITAVIIDSSDVSEHPVLAPLYDEGILEVSITATGNVVRSDYGVPNSPVWYEIEEIEIEEFEINGVAYSEKAVVEKWGKAVVDELYGVCAEAVAERDDWE